MKNLMGILGAAAVALAAVLPQQGFADDAFSGATMYTFMNTGTSQQGGQRVKTDYYPNGKTIVRAKYSSSATHNQCLYCARVSTSRSTSDPDFSYFIRVDAKPRFDYYNQTYAGSKNVVSDQVYLLEVKNGVATLTDEDGNELDKMTRSGGVVEFGTTPHVIHLFNSYSHNASTDKYDNFGNGAACKFYYLKIYEVENDKEVLKREYRPCLTADGTVAVAETVTKTVLYNGVSPNTFTLTGSKPLMPQLTVKGNPGDYGDIDYSSLVTNAESTVTRKAFDGAWTNAAGNVAATCAGYQLFTNNADNVAVEMASGDTTTCTFTMPNRDVTLQWNFTAEYQVVLRLVDNGAATGAGWFDRGESVTLTATPDAGYKFVCWRSPDASFVTNVNPYVFAIQDGGTYVPVFAEDDVSVRWLSPTGSDDNDGLTPTTAMFLPSNIIEKVKDEVKTRIFALPGTYAVSNFTRISTPVTLEGLSDDNADTVFSWLTTREHSWTTWSEKFILNHEQATLRNLTVANGRESDGANVQITKNGGLVEDCVIRNGSNPLGWSGSGGNLYLSGGRVTRTVIANGWGNNGGAFRMSAGVIENCLVTGNNGSYASGYAEGSGKVVNCTFSKNNNATQSALYVAKSGTAQAINCIIAGNTAANDLTGYGMVWGGDSNKFVNCLSPEWKISNTSLQADPVFADSANGDYSLTVASPARDAGATYADTGAISETDLAGNARVVGSAVDIGCYEYAAQGMACDFQVAQPDGGVIPCPVVFTATVEGSALGATLTYAWKVTDANGDTIYTTETSDPTMTWNCSLAGTFDAELTVTDSTSASAKTVRQAVAKTCQRELYAASGNANAAFPYATAATGAKTIKEALDVAVDGCTIWVVKGTYSISSAIGLSKNVAILGLSGNPADVKVSRSGGNIRLFLINHKDACVANLTVHNGYVDGYGGGVYIDAQGGTISNCCITGCAGAGWDTGAGGIFASSANAHITRCVVTNCTAGKMNTHYGAAVQIHKGKMDNTLVTGCPANITALEIVYASDGATVENCTIVDNLSTSAVGIKSASAKNVIRNTAIYNNAKGAWDGKNAATYFNCAADGDLAESNATCKVVAAKDFKDYANRDYRPSVSGVLYNGGDTQSGQADQLDLLGKPRVQGRSVDIGCYEATPAGLRFTIR